MEFVSGTKLAMAIDDLATKNLENAEQEMSDQLAKEISHTFGVDPDTIPQRLINGMMRGSTSLKIDQIVDEIHRMQGRMKDGRDAEELATRILNNVEKQRKDIHRQRIQRSAVRQVLRALSSDSLRSPGLEEWNSSSIYRLQSELQDAQIQSQYQIFDWASAVLRLYFELFVETVERDSSLTRKSKGLVSPGAAKNYSSAWIRFIEENDALIFSNAESGRLDTDYHMRKSYSDSKSVISTRLMKNDMMSDDIMKLSMEPASFAQEPSFAKDATSKYEIIPIVNADSKETSDSVSVLITEHKNGQKPQRIEQNWPSRENALQGLTKFFIVLENLVPNNARIDHVEISMTVNGQTETLTLEEIDPAGLKSMLQALLTA